MVLDSTTFHNTLEASRTVVVGHLPDPTTRLDFDSQAYANNLYDDLQVACELLPQGARVPDIGCGKGHISVLLAEAGYNVIGAVLEHVDPAARQSFLRGIARVLRPGGYLLIFKCPRRWALAEHVAAAVGLPHHSLLVAERQLRGWLESAGLIVSRLERTDVLPAFPPRALQGCWNRLAPLLNIAEHILRRTPWKLVAHHLRAVAQKPTQAERQVNP